RAPTSRWAEERVGEMVLFGVPIVTLFVEGQERLCLAQISTSLLQDFSYNEIHNRRVALGITCLQCTPAQLEVLRRAGAMPVTSRRCGLITRREAERLVRSFIADVPPPRLPDNFFFRVRHQCGWGNEGVFVPARYNSSRAKCIKCSLCDMYFSPNKFIFHCHPTPTATYRHPDAANFNSWRRHLELVHDGKDERLMHAWEDVKAMFNGGSRKRVTLSSAAFSASASPSFASSSRSSLSFDSYLYGNKNNDEPDPRPHPNGENRHGYGHSNSTNSNKNNAEIQSWRKLQLEKNLGASSQPTLPFSGGALGLVPPASFGGNAHPAFFAAMGLHGQVPPVSYGEFLRSMSRPYNLTNVPLAGSGLIPEMYRSSPAAQNLASGMIGASSYPLSYLGYPPYFPPASVSQIKGGNSSYFSSQLSNFRGLPSGRKPENVVDKEVHSSEKSAAVPEISKSSEDTQDEIIVDEEDNREKTNDEITSQQTPENNSDGGRRADSLQQEEDCNNSAKKEEISPANDKDDKKFDERGQNDEKIPTEKENNAGDGGNVTET
ncbi:uncharacterized protein LOC143282276, partial [Babylonia areolata]|uniref:uncharacterized protein LOC143282276 n=1 Tax=Babylonia areolata TaxID=304850 RepID=UPI003FD142FE